MDDETRTIWCGNLSDKVSEEVLYELFLQVAPIERVRIPMDKSGRKANFGFVTLKHEISVAYVVQLLDGTCLYDRQLNIKPRNANRGNNQNNLPMQSTNVQSNILNVDQLLFMGQQMMFTPSMQVNDNSDGNRRDDDRSNRHRKGRYNTHDDGYDANRDKWNSNNYRNNYNRGQRAFHGHDNRNRSRHSRFY